jgi:two-component system, LytTR family, response regulator LytT
MNIIIIEDERRTANELQTILEGIDGEIRVRNILPSVASAIRWLRENPLPDLIFSDIQLGDGLKF